MIYCARGTGSDVFMYDDELSPPHRTIMCAGCLLMPELTALALASASPVGRWSLAELLSRTHEFMTAADAIEHLKEHARAGHKIPLAALQRLAELAVLEC